MHDDAERPGEIEIRTPCPKRWEELAGPGRERYCDACELYVHDGSAMTESEARALIQGSPQRICMRLQYDPSGAPVFQEAEPRIPAPWLPRWALTAIAGALAACSDAARIPDGRGVPPDTGHLPSRMGRPAAPQVLGEVSIAEPPVPARLGEAVVRTEPAAPDGATLPQAPK